MQKKAQSSLEFLLLIGAALIVAAVVISLAMNMMTSGNEIAHAAYNSLEENNLFSVSVCEGTETCSMTPDGCCPASCNSANDADCSTSSTPPSTPINLLTNPGFESDLTSGWSASVMSSSGTSRATDEVHSGTYSLKICLTGAAGCGSPGTITGRQQNVGSSLAGKKAKLSGWIKTNLIYGLANLDLYQGGYIDSSGITVFGATDWRYYTECIDVPSGATNLYVRAFVNDSPQGNVWFDDITLTEGC